MKRFLDERTEEVYYSAFAIDVPKRIAIRAKWTICLLLAVHSWDDIGIIGEIARWPSSPGRFGIHINGKWYVTFEWEQLIGAVRLKLERR